MNIAPTSVSCDKESRHSKMVQKKETEGGERKLTSGITSALLTIIGVLERFLRALKNE